MAEHVDRQTRTASGHEPIREMTEPAPGRQTVPEPPGGSAPSAAVQRVALGSRGVAELAAMIGARGPTIDDRFGGAQHRDTPIQLGKKDRDPSGKKAGKAKPDSQGEAKLAEAVEARYGIAPTIAGAGVSGADVYAYDGDQLVIFEQKGNGNPWMSANNKTERGNTPAKQITKRLRSFLQRDLAVTGTVQEYLTERSRDGHANVHLGVHTIDDVDALLAIVWDDDKQRLKTYPMTLTKVVNFIDSCFQVYPEKIGAPAMKTVKELNDDLDTSNGWYSAEIDARWSTLETAFDTARHKNNNKFDRTNTEGPRLSRDQHVTLVPVHHRAPPPTQLKASPDGDVDRRAGAQLPGGTGAPLPDDLRRRMELAFGTDFSTVRYRESDAPDQLGAHAFAQGEELHFAPGMFQPGTESGERLIGHELAHVTQQRAGRVAVPQGHGGNVNVDEALEREADDHGARAARGERLAGPAHSAAGLAAETSAVQLMMVRKNPKKSRSDKETNESDNAEGTGLATDTVLKHIIEGEERNKGKAVVGYHSEIAGTYTVEITTCYPHGFYIGTVKKANKVVKSSSSFFPCTWDRNRIKQALERAQKVSGDAYRLHDEDGGYLLGGNAAGRYPDLHGVAALDRKAKTTAIRERDAWARERGGRKPEGEDS